jgi:AAA+ superfamily predicted ATPase
MKKNANIGSAPYYKAQGAAKAELSRTTKAKKVKQVTTAISRALGGAIGIELLSPIMKIFMEQIKSNAVHSISIKENLQRIQYGLFKFFDNYEDSVDVDTLDDYTPVQFSKNVEWTRGQSFQKIIMWKGVPIMLKSTFSPENFDGYSKFEIKLVTINNPKCINTLKAFIKECYRISLMNLDNELKRIGSMCVIHDSADFDYIKNRKLRTFDDVFVPDSVYHQIMDPIKKYVESYDFYESSNIPNHFGVLLYSDPGTGKSSIAQAIANEINALFYVTSGDNIAYIDNIIRQKICIDPIVKTKYRVLCIEDVDAGLDNMQSMLRTRRYEVNNDDVPYDEKPLSASLNKGLATILNALDGAASPKNIVYIMTTNHKDKLDPALIRPGRCDICVEIPTVCPETLKEFIDKYFPGNNITPTHVGDGLTFATLQVELMRGKTAQEIVDFASTYTKSE